MEGSVSNRATEVGTRQSGREIASPARLGPPVSVLKLIFAPGSSLNRWRRSARPLEPPNAEILWHRNKSVRRALTSLVQNRV